MYYNGLGVDKDLSEAAKWYLSAAEQGSDKAQNDIGYMYDKGLGVEQNTAAAVKWYRKAAQQGNKQAVGNMKSLGYNP